MLKDVFLKWWVGWLLEWGDWSDRYWWGGILRYWWRGGIRKMKRGTGSRFLMLEEAWGFCFLFCWKFILMVDRDWLYVYCSGTYYFYLSFICLLYCCLLIFIFGFMLLGLVGDWGFFFMLWLFYVIGRLVSLVSCVFEGECDALFLMYLRKTENFEASISISRFSTTGENNFNIPNFQKKKSDFGY